MLLMVIYLSNGSNSKLSPTCAEWSYRWTSRDFYWCCQYFYWSDQVLNIHILLLTWRKYSNCEMNQSYRLSSPRLSLSPTWPTMQLETRSSYSGLLGSRLSNTDGSVLTRVTSPEDTWAGREHLEALADRGSLPRLRPRWHWRQNSNPRSDRCLVKLHMWSSDRSTEVVLFHLPAAPNTELESGGSRKLNEVSAGCELALTLRQAHVDAPVVLQTLQLLLHASLAAAVVQRRVLQHLQRSLALLGRQHGAALLVPAGETLAHDPVPWAALAVLVAQFRGPDAVQRFPPARGAQLRVTHTHIWRTHTHTHTHTQRSQRLHWW